MAWGREDGSISLVETEGRNEVGRLQRHSVSIERLLFNRDGTMLVSFSTDGTAVTWSLGP